jgi:hypothetical protein
MAYLVGHCSPDWDCIAALWLLQRFGGFADAEIKLVNTGQPDAAILVGAAAVVDTGRELDPLRNRFDHHHLPGTEANSCCAASLVFQWITSGRDDMEYLGPLVALICAGDTGSPAARESRVVGIHALLSAWKARGIIDDLHLIDRGYDVLDDLAEHLLRAQEARESLTQYTVYTSADGRLVALDQAGQGATHAAFEAGALLVVWHNPIPDVPTVAVGINRAPESGIDCGRLVKAAMWNSAGMSVWEELSTWYRHNSGFFAGRGTPKAPDPRPLGVPLTEIAAALDAAWER